MSSFSNRRNNINKYNLIKKEIIVKYINENKKRLLSENKKRLRSIRNNIWLWEDKENIDNVEMTVALPSLKGSNIIWLALESLKNQIDIDFQWELIVLEERGDSLDIVKSYKELLPGCVRIIFKTLKNGDGIFNTKYLKNNGFPSYYTLLEKWVNSALLADKNSKIFVKHAVDCYSPPKRLYIHYKHFQNKDCYYSTQPKGYFYNIKDNKYFLYNGNKIEPRKMDHYFKKYQLKTKKYINNKSVKYRSCHLNMALSLNIMKKIPLKLIKRGIDGYILSYVSSITGIRMEEKKIIYTDDEICKDNWKYSLDTDGYNNISLSRKKYYYNSLKQSPQCIPTKNENVNHNVPEYILERLKNLNK